MDPVNPLTRLAELLRKRIDTDSVTTRVKKSTHQGKASEPNQRIQRSSVADLQRELSHSLEAIDPDRPESRQKAIRVFVETVLVWQFGGGVLNDPAFSTLASEVQSVLDKDESVTQTLNSLISNGK